MNALRQRKLVDELLKHEALDERLLQAFMQIDRTLFVPTGFAPIANRLSALPMQNEQWISSPLTVAKMTKALNCENSDSILEIGCGSGYQAAILSKLFRRVFSIERVENLLQNARDAFKKIHISNINTKFDDGASGWVEYAPFDRILLSASTPDVPKKLFEQLSDKDGILVAPIEKRGRQIITRFVKGRYNIKSEELEECLFVPVVCGVVRS